MAEEKWEKQKKRGVYKIIETDEIVLIALGILTFLRFPLYKIIFIVGIIIWYWINGFPALKGGEFTPTS